MSSLSLLPATSKDEPAPYYVDVHVVPSLPFATPVPQNKDTSTPSNCAAILRIKLIQVREPGKTESFPWNLSETDGCPLAVRFPVSEPRSAAETGTSGRR